MAPMTVDLDQELLAQAQEAAGTPTKKATVEAGLRELVRRKRVEGLIARFGTGAVDMTPEELQEWRRQSIRTFDEPD
jgi:Arc/MetJ family transcription regulator